MLKWQGLIRCDGIDPDTDEVFPDDSPYQRPKTICVLFVAIRAIESLLVQEQQGQQKKKQVDNGEGIRKSQPLNAGKAWTKDEIEALIDAFERGDSTKELAKKHQRTEFAITSQRLKLGRIPVDMVNLIDKAVESPPEDIVKDSSVYQPSQRSTN